MKKRTLVMGLAVLTAVLVLSSCGDDEEPTGWEDTNCIGPEGGTETLDEGFLEGVQVRVAPGAWQDCWTVWLRTETTFTTPNFPDGLEGYEGVLSGSLNMQISRMTSWDTSVPAPDSMDMSIIFPVADLTTEVGEVLTAFRWDEDAGIWRMALPDTLDDMRLVVDTYDHQPLWTWGTVDLTEADFDLYVSPAMDDMIGTESWARVQQELEDLHDTIVSEQLGISCSNLASIRSAFAGMRDQAEVNLQTFQNGLGGLCGECDVTDVAFYESILEYWKLRAQSYIAQLFLIENSPHWIVSIFGHLMVASYESAMDQLPCEFLCFFGEGTTEFYVDLSIFYASIVTIELIDFFIQMGYIDC